MVYVPPCCSAHSLSSLELIIVGIAVALFMYADSIVFAVSAAMLQHVFGINDNLAICDLSELLCLVCESFIKMAGYCFLIERVASLVDLCEVASADAECLFSMLSRMVTFHVCNQSYTCSMLLACFVSCNLYFLILSYCCGGIGL